MNTMRFLEKMRSAACIVVTIGILGLLNYLAYRWVSEISLSYIIFVSAITLKMGFCFWFFSLMRNAAGRD